MVLNFGNTEMVNSPALFKLSKHTLCTPASSAPVERSFSTSGLIMQPQRARLFSKMLEVHVSLKCNCNFWKNKEYIDWVGLNLVIYCRFIFRDRIIVGLGLGLDYSWSRSRTTGLEKRPVLV